MGGCLFGSAPAKILAQVCMDPHCRIRHQKGGLIWWPLLLPKLPPSGTQSYLPHPHPITVLFHPPQLPFFPLPPSLPISPVSTSLCRFNMRGKVLSFPPALLQCTTLHATSLPALWQSALAECSLLKMLITPSLFLFSNLSF